jgi:hypothetical protein
MKELFNKTIDKIQNNLKAQNLNIEDVAMLYTMFSLTNDIIQTNPDAVVEVFNKLMDKLNKPYYTTNISVPISQINGSILN